MVKINESLIESYTTFTNRFKIEYELYFDKQRMPLRCFGVIGFLFRICTIDLYNYLDYVNKVLLLKELLQFQTNERNEGLIWFPVFNAASLIWGHGFLLFIFSLQVYLLMDIEKGISSNTRYSAVTDVYALNSFRY